MSFFIKIFFYFQNRNGTNLIKKQYAKKTMQELYPLPWDQQKKLPGKKKKNIDAAEFWADIDKRTKN